MTVHATAAVTYRYAPGSFPPCDRAPYSVDQAQPPTLHCQATTQNTPFLHPLPPPPQALTLTHVLSSTWSLTPSSAAAGMHPWTPTPHLLLGNTLPFFHPPGPPLHLLTLTLTHVLSSTWSLTPSLAAACSSCRASLAPSRPPAARAAALRPRAWNMGACVWRRWA
jgi:hypothetical protein